MLLCRMAYRMQNLEGRIVAISKATMASSQTTNKGKVIRPLPRPVHLRDKVCRDQAMAPAQKQMTNQTMASSQTTNKGIVISKGKDQAITRPTCAKARPCTNKVEDKSHSMASPQAANGRELKPLYRRHNMLDAYPEIDSDDSADIGMNDDSKGTYKGMSDDSKGTYEGQKDDDSKGQKDDSKSIGDDGQGNKDIPAMRTYCGAAIESLDAGDLVSARQWMVALREDLDQRCSALICDCH